MDKREVEARLMTERTATAQRLASMSTDLAAAAAAIEATSPEGVTGPVPSRREIPSLMGQGFKVRSVHHTTPVAGMPVKGAGLLTLDHDRIVEITDESGHYRPDAAQQFLALQELIKQGYDLESAKVMLTGKGGGGGARPTDKANWLDAAAQANVRYPTGSIELGQEQFAQTGGDDGAQRRAAGQPRRDACDHGEPRRTRATTGERSLWPHAHGRRQRAGQPGRL